jgi:FkbM family methyltransferase
MISPLDSLIVFFNESEIYECDFTDKTVLDVGGYCGETAVFFWSRGAKKIIVYEPVLVHHEFIRKNVQLSGIKAELHEEGIGKDDGTIAVNYDYANQEFGLLSEGKSQSEIRIRNVTDAIIESKADIAKFDCEGAETSLVDLSNETLSKIGYYVIETHTRDIRKAIIEKFEKAGFRMARSPKEVTNGVSVLCFEKV